MRGRLGEASSSAEVWALRGAAHPRVGRNGARRLEVPGCVRQCRPVPAAAREVSAAAEVNSVLAVVAVIRRSAAFVRRGISSRARWCTRRSGRRQRCRRRTPRRAGGCRCRSAGRPPPHPSDLFVVELEGIPPRIVHRRVTRRSALGEQEVVVEPRFNLRPKGSESGLDGVQRTALLRPKGRTGRPDNCQTATGEPRSTPRSATARKVRGSARFCVQRGRSATADGAASHLRVHREGEVHPTAQCEFHVPETRELRSIPFRLDLARNVRLEDPIEPPPVLQDARSQRITPAAFAVDCLAEGHESIFAAATTHFAARSVEWPARVGGEQCPRDGRTGPRHPSSLCTASLARLPSAADSGT